MYSSPRMEGFSVQVLKSVCFNKCWEATHDKVRSRLSDCPEWLVRVVANLARRDLPCADEIPIDAHITCAWTYLCQSANYKLNAHSHASRWMCALLREQTFFGIRLAALWTRSGTPNRFASSLAGASRPVPVAHLAARTSSISWSGSRMTMCLLCFTILKSCMLSVAWFGQML